jgi:hypothetical protein
LLWLLLAALLVSANSVSAQQTGTLKGRVISGGQPVANQPVALHRVTADDGRTISTDTTAADGTFVLALDSAGLPGIRFVGTRHEGQIYIGEMFRAEPPADYVVRIGPGGTPLNLGAATTSTPAPAPAPDSNAAGTMIIILSGLGLAGLLLFATRQRRSPIRQLLVEIADLDNRNEVTPLAQYDRQRAELMQRLRESA